MALFKKDSKDSVEVVESTVADLSWVIKNPRITEKAALISSGNVYTFDIATRANKILVKKAIQEKYGVKALKVNVISKKARKETRRGRKVHKTGSKKAMVFLKDGDTIELA